MRDRYANKGTIPKIFHKYTGLIVFGVIMTVTGVSWYQYESEQVFFEEWSCNQILSMGIDELSPKEFLRYEEIKSECKYAP